jgi:hypothetical protein
MRVEVSVVVVTAVVVVVVVVLEDGVRRSTRQRNVGGHGVAGAEGNRHSPPPRAADDGR